MSYKLHAELASTHHGAERWGYRTIHCGQLTAEGRSSNQTSSKDGKLDEPVSPRKKRQAVGNSVVTGMPEDLNWIASDCAKSYDEMGDPSTTAQVHPYQFTTSMAALAEEKGVQVIIGSVLDIEKSGNAVKSVTFREKSTNKISTIPATDVIISAGPWTKSVYPPAPIAALRAHSVTIRPSKPVSAYAIFTEISLPSDTGRTKTFVKSKRSHRKTVTPEIYARPNNEVYACGEGDNLVSLPKTTEDVETDEARCQDIVDYVSSISNELRDGMVTVRQACYLPNVETASGGPLIGETGIKGLFMAAGHTCWGIQNGPGTGKLISEFVFDGKAKSANIESLDPRQVL